MRGEMYTQGNGIDGSNGQIRRILRPEDLKLVWDLRDGFASIREDTARLEVEPSLDQKRIQAVAIVNICADLTANIVENVGVEVQAGATGEQHLIGALFGVGRDGAAHIANLVRADAEHRRAQELAAALSRAFLDLPNSLYQALSTLCSLDLEDRWITRRLSARGVTLPDIALGCGAWPWIQARRGIHPSSGTWGLPPQRVDEFGTDDELIQLGTVMGNQPIGWLGCRSEEQLDLLELAGVLNGLDREQKDTARRLAPEWNGSIGELVHTAKSL